jgi:hypothetical protein
MANGFVPEGQAAFVPEGQADSSQARSAWVTMQRGPVPEGRSKSWSEVFVVETELMPLENARYPELKGMLASNLSRDVQSSRWDGAIFLMPPGTSCLATIMLSLWDKINSPPSRL